MLERKAEDALWWAAAAGAFLLWQTAAWLVARGRWQRAREKGVCLPPPRFMGDMADNAACFLIDMLPVLLGLIPIAVAFAGVIFVLVGVAMPLWFQHGPAAGIAGGALVWGAGASASIAVLVRIGERQREAKERERARWRRG